MYDKMIEDICKTNNDLKRNIYGNRSLGYLRGDIIIDQHRPRRNTYKRKIEQHLD